MRRRHDAGDTPGEHRHGRPEDPQGDLPEEPSKSQRKRDAAELQALGVRLVGLAPAQLDGLPLPEKLRDAINLAKRITAHGALARQQQFIGKLMRKIDVAPIRAALEQRELEQRLAARGFHRVEAWRDRLVDEGEPAIAALLAAHPELEAARLRALVDEARAERAADRPRAASRTLFRWLRDALAGTQPSA